ncbi:MAG: transposase [Thermodesulfobacteriota bacterium]
MGTIQDIFRTFGPEYLQRFGEAIPHQHRKVIDAIVRCRTEDSGVAIFQCEQCGQPHIVLRSCGNRHCPNCQYLKSQEWLHNQIERQLPGHHFMLTFTLPEEIRPFFRSHQKAAYGALFQASSDAIKKLASDQKHIGGDLPGFFGVLHTWGRQLHYHPHIHYVVPGGALSTQDGSWHPSRLDFYLPVRPLSTIYRAKFRDAMAKVGLLPSIPNHVWQLDWNVNCQAVGASESSLKYLAPYVFKVAISDSRIHKVEDRKVSFRYRKPHSRRMRTVALDALEFIRRFLQHVLPRGFMKIRYYGFMSPSCAVPLEKIRALIELAWGFRILTAQMDIQLPPPMACPLCGGILRYRFSLAPRQRSP